MHGARLSTPSGEVIPRDSLGGYGGGSITWWCCSRPISGPLFVASIYGRDTELECQHAGCKGCAKVHDGRDE